MWPPTGPSPGPDLPPTLDTEREAAKSAGGPARLPRPPPVWAGAGPPARPLASAAPARSGPGARRLQTRS
eukprot:3430188-Lingulodinium_polyedra.AAC.1